MRSIEHRCAIESILDSMAGAKNRWEIWRDFIAASAVSISNAMPGCPDRDAREQEYLAISERYEPGEMVRFAEMLGHVVNAFEGDPDQDFLGDLYMQLGFGDSRKGQFFTPYNLCQAMSKIAGFPDVKGAIESQGFYGVSDPACGAGATLIAFANECKRSGINYQQAVFFVGQDVDRITAMMCYIQLSLLGCPGYIAVGNTLSNPCVSKDERGLIPGDNTENWFTPMYYSNLWTVRRMMANPVRKEN